MELCRFWSLSAKPDGLSLGNRISSMLLYIKIVDAAISMQKII